uniref:Sushi domain-containing protein n=1 Tax=Oreochromis niloticus TaxID=8128 RepID=A0A669B8Z5_ORENI
FFSSFPILHFFCVLACSTLPDVPHAQVTQETRKSQYQAGDMIHFDCESGYTSALTIKYVCTTEAWQPLQKGSCYRDFPSGLFMVPIRLRDPQVLVTVLYVCNVAFWWLDPLSSDYLPSLFQGLTVKGLPENCLPIRPNHILTFSCDGPGKYLNGVSVLICGQDGQWNNPFPTCIVGVMHPHLYVAGLPPSNEIMATGHKLRFLCSNTHELIGSTEIECLENGQWNSSFPTCSDGKTAFKKGNNVEESVERSCGRPPPVSDGDTKTSTKQQYQHNERVEYICQKCHIMVTGPFKTCVDGEWIGEIRCLLLIGLRQRCENGVIHLPTCQ